MIGVSHREHGNHCRQDKLQYFDLSLLHIYGILRGMDRARAALADLTALDRTALEALIVAQQSELSAQQEKLLNRDSEIEHLKLVIAKLRRMMFGTKSEKGHARDRATGTQARRTGDTPGRTRCGNNIGYSCEEQADAASAA